jgi:hypothetical protein
MGTWAAPCFRMINVNGTVFSSESLLFGFDIIFHVDCSFERLLLGKCIEVGCVYPPEHTHHHHINNIGNLH